MLKERFSRFKAAKKFEDKNWVMGSCLTLIKFPIITLIYLFFLPFEFLCFYSSFLCFFGFFLLLANKTVFNDLSKFLSAIPLSYLFCFLISYLCFYLSFFPSMSAILNLGYGRSPRGYTKCQILLIIFLWGYGITERLRTAGLSVFESLSVFGCVCQFCILSLKKCLLDFSFFPLFLLSHNYKNLVQNNFLSSNMILFFRQFAL